MRSGFYRICIFDVHVFHIIFYARTTCRLYTAMGIYDISYNGVLQGTRSNNANIVKCVHHSQVRTWWTYGYYSVTTRRVNTLSGGVISGKIYSDGQDIYSCLWPTLIERKKWHRKKKKYNNSNRKHYVTAIIIVCTRGTALKIFKSHIVYRYVCMYSVYTGT